MYKGAACNGRFKALALVEIDDAIWVVIEPRKRHVWIFILGNHLTTLLTWTCSEIFGPHSPAVVIMGRCSCFLFLTTMELLEEMMEDKGVVKLVVFVGSRERCIEGWRQGVFKAGRVVY